MEILKKILKLILRKIKKEKEIFFFVFFLLLIFVIIGSTTKKFLVKIPKKGGEFHEIIIAEKPMYINPVLGRTDIDKNLISLIYSPLFKKDKNGNLVPNIADLKISDDGKTYHIYLKKNILFQDGEKLTADDVIFTIKQIQDPINNSFYRAQWIDVKVKKIDDYSLDLILPQTNYYFKDSLILYILPKHVWEKEEYFNSQNRNLNPIGSGPFKLYKKIYQDENSEIENNEKIKSIILEKNDKYWNGDIYISKIYFDFFDTDEKYMSSELFKKNIYQNIYSYDNKEYLKKFNVKRINEGIDFDFIIKNHNKNSLLNNINFRRYIFAIWNSDLEEISKAEKALLKSDNFKRDKKNNLILYKGKVASFSVNLGNNQDNSIRDLGDKFKNKLSKYGIVLNLNLLDEKEFFDKLRSRDFETMIFGLDNSERSMFYYYHSSQKEDPWLNVAQFNSNKIDNLLIYLRKNLSEEERKKKLKELKKEINSNYLILSLEKQKSYYYLSKNIYSMHLDKIYSGLNRFDFIQNWIINTEKVWPIFVKESDNF